MKKILLPATLMALAFGAMAQTELTVRIDTKLMYNVDCNLLGDGAGGPAQVNKVYMHSGACSENRGTNQALTAQQYCLQEILPYASDVWQHVVGNWGANPQDDGVGQMTAMGNGIYEKTFVVEQYYSDPNLVSNEINSTGTTQSTPLPAGNTVHVIGMVFRNETGQASGRDQQGCNDIFVVNFAGDNPQIINSTDFSTCNYVTIIKATGIEDHKLVQGINVMPNPAEGQTTIDVNLWQEVKGARLNLTDLTGREVASRLIDLNVGSNKISIDLSSVPAGVYALDLRSRTGIMATQRIVVRQ